MAKKILIAAVLGVLALVYYFQYRDHFARRDIDISVTMRPKFLRGQPVVGADGQPSDMVVFALGQEYKLTSIKVSPKSDAVDRGKPAPAWELVSQSNSVPTIDFEYGHKIRGMHAAVKDAEINPLQPNTEYRITVEAGSLKGSHDFRTRGEATSE